eukprot:Skav232001  [mRNA]  locus=scaffold719:547221:575173:- [translate_table: standard]
MDAPLMPAVAPVASGRAESPFSAENSPHVAPARRRQASSPVRLSGCRHQLHVSAGGGPMWRNTSSMQGTPPRQRPPPTEAFSESDAKLRPRMDSAMTFGGSRGDTSIDSISGGQLGRSLPLPPMGSLAPSREDSSPVVGHSINSTLPQFASADLKLLGPRGAGRTWRVLCCDARCAVLRFPWATKVMAVIVGASNGVTRFSSLEYQAIMFCLAFAMCLTMAVVEVVMKRFALLPVIFPGVFAIREKRLYFFDIEVKEVSVGKALRWEAMMVMRVTLAVVLSYLWEFCVFESTTNVGREFPVNQCRAGMDCFVTQFQIQTFLSRNHQPFNCSSEAKGDNFFDEQVVISCVKFITPSMSSWLMHLAIAHSMSQLNLKSFGLLVWCCGQSVWFHRVMLATSVISLLILFGLSIGGVMTKFQSSWSGFVMSMGGVFASG